MGTGTMDLLDQRTRVGETEAMRRLLLVTGMSGAGRSTASAALEDLGWHVIDNLPVPLIAEAADLVNHPGAGHERVAFVLGRGGPVEIAQLEPVLEVLTERYDVDVFFLDADDDVLVRRYEGTRRRHPRSRVGVIEAIAEERALLQPVAERASVVLNTSELSSNQLRLRMRDLFGDPADQRSMRTSVVSFGFKYGIPLDVDLVFDVRFLPNPYWEVALRSQSGLDGAVRDYVFGQDATGTFVDKLEDLLAFLVPCYEQEGKSYLTIAIGCTGGRHRSVAVAEELARRLGAGGIAPGISVFHRDIDR